jgi:thiol-disulfide isomerase/thioredoxin
MLPRSPRLALLVALMAVTGTHAADPPPASRASVKLARLDPAKYADPKVAAATAAEIEKEYAGKPQPEAVKMLLAILKGSLMGAGDGWFGPAQSRYTWAWLAEKHGLDATAKGITRDTFAGPPDLFARLDRDGDGTVTPADLDWSEKSPYLQQAAMVTRFFRRMDMDGDSKLSREDFDAFLKRAGGGKDYLTPDDLKAALLATGPGGFLPGDRPSIPMLVDGLYSSELGSLQEGPAVGEAAPDFELKTADGAEAVKLSKLVGPKPVVLVFGNFTCGPFRAIFPEADALRERYKDRATFVMVYVREAHPLDGWKMESNTKVGVAVKQPTTTAERAAVCEQFRTRLKPGMTVLVDDIGDPAGNAYSGMPARFYVIDPKGKVAYKSGRGPFGFKSGEMEQALVMSLLEAAPAAK